MFTTSDLSTYIYEGLAYFIIVYSLILTFTWLLFRYPLEIKKNILDLEVKNITVSKPMRVKIALMDSLFFNLRFVAFFLNFLFTLLGMQYGKWFFTLNLFLVTNLSQNLNYILLSITKHFSKLVITLFMTFLLIFSYTFIFMQRFTPDVNEDEFGTEVCLDYFNCFFNAMNNGMRFGGGISDFLHFQPEPDHDKYWSRFFFDISYFFLV